jgi:hypothetical protein
MLKALVAAAVVLLLSVSSVEADGARASVSSPLSRGSIIPDIPSIVPRVGPIVPHGPNIVPNPPRERDVVRDGRRFHRRPDVIIVNPPLVYAAPVQQCVSDGYWAYQWVPTAYTENTWVPGLWRADGVWLEGHYEQRAYSSGYYQPYWVPGQPYAC